MRNPLARTIEAKFSITLPLQAAVNRFAMKYDEDASFWELLLYLANLALTELCSCARRVREVWQEGEVVEVARARSIFEDFLHRCGVFTA